RTRVATTTIMVGLILLTLLVSTFAQVQFWKTSITLFEHALKVTEKNYMTHKLLAGALMQQGKLTEARDQLEKSLQLRPGYADAHHDLGTVFIKQNDFANAQKHFNLALKSRPNDPIIWNALGIADSHLGRIDEAIGDYRRALTFNPNYAFALAN